MADNGAHNSHTEPGSSTDTGGHGGHNGTDTTPTGGHGDTPSTGGGHDTPSTGGGHDGPTVPRQGADPISGGDLPSGGHGDPKETSGPAGWEQAQGSGPLERGGALEQQIGEQIRGTTTKHSDLPAILETLENHPAGREMADTIASGRFKDSQGFGYVVSNLSRPDEASGCLEQIRLANRLHEQGFTDLSFEIKQDGHEIKPGVFTGPKTDLDLMAREADGTVHGWQFKDMTGPKSPDEPAKVVRNIFKSMHQLIDSHADVQTFVVETKASKAEILTQIDRIQERFDAKNVQFVIRTPDGVIFVPRDGHFTPEVAP
ncbi:hypothetical protein [Streptomyces sp. AB3(2024)]|uniref:hypothetical protein n=1 Tax=Streptomyces sp. AB3(2024) TaxID=3317321 RepID=UPI0035A2BDF0